MALGSTHSEGLPSLPVVAQIDSAYLLAKTPRQLAIEQTLKAVGLAKHWLS